MRQRTADSRREIRPESGATVLGLLSVSQMQNDAEYLEGGRINLGLPPNTHTDPRHTP